MRSTGRRSLLHFLVLGGLLFAFERALPGAAAMPDQPALVRIEAGAVARLRADWQREVGRQPTDAELRAGIEREIDTELLLAEARRLQLDLTDPVARERLLLNMRFAFPARRASDEALLHEARALGMSGSDPVLRRRLVQLMERRLLQPVQADADALRDYVEQHAQRYATPERHGFRHIWFRDANDVAVSALLQTLARDEEPVWPSGDAFLLGASLAPASAEELARRFGVEFAQAIAQAPLARWHGPLESVYGVHFVRVEQRTAAQMPPLDVVRDAAHAAWSVEQRAVVLQAALQQLRERYRVEIAHGAAEPA